MGHHLVSLPAVGQLAGASAALQVSVDVASLFPNLGQELSRRPWRLIPSLHIAEEINENQFKIAGGSRGMKVSWQVTGIRKDLWAKAHPMTVEQEKAVCL